MSKTLSSPGCWRRHHPDRRRRARRSAGRAPLDYKPTGSLAGIMRVREGAVDLGVSEMPLRSEELRRLGLDRLPLLIGRIVAVATISGVGPGQLQLTGHALADSHLGHVAKWSDPSLKALNPQIALADIKIAAVCRSDGSGMTFNFTDFLGTARPLCDWSLTHGNAETPALAYGPLPPTLVTAVKACWAETLGSAVS